MDKNKIYTKVLKSLGIGKDEESVLNMEGNVLKINGKPMVLEIGDYDIDEVVIFDPIDEDLSKVDLGLKKLLRIITLKTNAMMFEIVRLLITADDKIDLPSYLHILLAEAIGAVEDSGSKTKKPIQASTIKALEKFESYIIEEDLFFLKATIKNPIIDKGEKFLSGVIITSPMVKEFKDMESEVHTLNKRDEDSVLIESLFTGLYTYLGLDGVASLTNATSVNMTAFMKFYMSYVEACTLLLRPLEAEHKEFHTLYQPLLKFDGGDINSLSELVPERKKSTWYDEEKTESKQRETSKGKNLDAWGEEIPEEISRVRGSNRNNNSNHYRGDIKERPIYVDKRGNEYFEEDWEYDNRGERFIYDEAKGESIYEKEDRGSNRNSNHGRDDNRNNNSNHDIGVRQERPIYIDQNGNEYFKDSWEKDNGDWVVYDKYLGGLVDPSRENWENNNNRGSNRNSNHGIDGRGQSSKGFVSV